MASLGLKLKGQDHPAGSDWKCRGQCVICLRPLANDISHYPVDLSPGNVSDLQSPHPKRHLYVRQTAGALELEAAPRQAAAPPTLTPSSTLASIPVEKRSKKNDGEYHSSVDLSMSTVRRALGKLRAQQASHDQNMAKIALQDTKRAFDQASDRLERAETEIKTLKKHSQDLTQTIETDTNLMETHNKAHKQVQTTSRQHPKPTDSP
eukprot:1387950-Amorphochlora_amoeboformis.AAC.1